MAALACFAALAILPTPWTAPRASAQEADAETAWRLPGDAEIEALLAERMAHNGVGIVIGIVAPDRRRVIAHGRSGAPDGRPLTEDTVFQIGSVTKVFTTLLLADMAQRGEVRLDDPAMRYLPPDVRMPRKDRDITLADLATHMSGLPAMPNGYDLTAPDPYAAFSDADLAAFLNAYEPDRAPGQAYAYSNLGVALLGRMLARSAGRDYEELLRERVLDPLGLSSTAVTLSADQAARLAPGHDRDLRPVDTWEMASLPGSGSLRSSVRDMMTALDAYLGYAETPLEDAIALQLGAVRQPIPGGIQMLGLSQRTLNGVAIIGHDGGKEGYRAALAFNPQTRTGVAILANARTDDTPIELAAWLLTGRPMGPVPEAPERPDIDAPFGALDRLAGAYRTETGATLRIAPYENRLRIERPGDGVTEFYPAEVAGPAATAPGAFRSNIADQSLSFIEEAGRIAGLTLQSGSRTERAERLEQTP